MRILGCLFVLGLGGALYGQELKAGYARRDITPREPLPMWGYADRRDRLSTGTLDPLYADALVLAAGPAKIALVGLDLGRSPNELSLAAIRKRIAEGAGIGHSIIAASHTHHGPVLELANEPGKGQGRFDAALRYYRQLEDSIVEAILEANGRLAPARLAAGTVQLENLNRNRHTKKEIKPVDRGLNLLRFDGADGKPLALLVNYTAHPTSLPSSGMSYSADYVGALKNLLVRETGAGAVFLQGAEGDQSTNRGSHDHQAYGELLGREALKLARSLTPQPAPASSLEAREQVLRFDARLDYGNPLIRMAFSQAFFPELVANYVDQYADGVRPRLTVALLNKEIAFVGVSGEVFAAHALRLRERSPAPHLFFCGMANGYHQYFPTIEAMAEGGYGAAASEAPAAPGAGETLMNTALVWLYQMSGKLR